MGMDLKKFANVDSFYRDLDTGMEIEWHDYMRRIIDKLGIENIKPYIPYNIPFLKEKLKTDIHFNNTSLRTWENAAGFLTYPFKYDVKYQGRGIASLFLCNRINVFSSSECVCVLKETARILCEMDADENDS